jgi:hypothetical protein
MRLSKLLSWKDSAGGKRISFIAILPILTLFVFIGLTALSLIEIKARAPQKKKPAAPVSAQVLARYKEESRKLEAIRSSARSTLTAEEILSMIESRKVQEIPLPEKLVSDLRAVERRAPGTAARFLPRFLSLVSGLYRKGDEEARIQAAEAVLAFAIFSGTAPQIDADGRKDLHLVLQGAVNRGSKFISAYLVLFDQVGRNEDIGKLKELQGRSGSPQLAHEIGKVIVAIEKKEVARG